MRPELVVAWSWRLRPRHHILIVQPGVSFQQPDCLVLRTFSHGSLLCAVRRRFTPARAAEENFEPAFKMCNFVHAAPVKTQSDLSR